MFRKVLKIRFLNRIDLSPLVEFPTYTHICRHSLNLFHYAPKHSSGTPATALLKSNMLVFYRSCLANSCRTDVWSQFKASPMQPASSAYKLRVQIRYNPLPFLFWLKKSSLRSTSSMQMSQREMLDLADRCIKSHVITEFPSVYSAPDVKECKSAAGSGVHLCSKFPHSQLLFSTSM